MAISIGSNIASLQAQRRLRTGTDTLEKIFERVASGLRINRASDDAAGLAIASSLNADRRIYSAALRNVNDGISALNIAEGGLQQLSGIVTRIAELAEQSANGVYSSAQRSALDSEARALRSEYERISESTTFNGISLLDGRVNIGLQVDKNTYLENGTNAGQLGITLGSSAATAVGDGTFEAASPISGVSTVKIASADLNGDGHADLINQVFAGFDVRLGDGASNFDAPISSSGGPGSGGVGFIETSDLDHDGDLDVVSDGPSGARVYLNDGNGSLTFRENIGSNGPVVLGDINNDGFDDLINADQFGTGDVSVYLNDGDGTFSLSTSFAESTDPYRLNLIDLNNDSNLDLISTDLTSGNVSTRMGNGSGGFGAQTVYSPGASAMELDFGDVNGDGHVDMIGITNFAFGAYLRLGRSDGTFESASTVSSLPNIAFTFQLQDLNGDGAEDVVTTTGTQAQSYINNGDGVFTLADSVSITGNGTERVAFGDFDGDGVADLVVTDPSASSIGIYTANSTYQGTLESFSLLSKDSALAALDQMRNYLPRISSELGGIGSMQSRLESTVRNLTGRSEAVAGAQARIEDADIAVEGANLIRTQILQRAAASVLSQANQLPALALQLLGG